MDEPTAYFPKRNGSIRNCDTCGRFYRDRRDASADMMNEYPDPDRCQHCTWPIK